MDPVPPRLLTPPSPLCGVMGSCLGREMVLGGGGGHCHMDEVKREP